MSSTTATTVKVTYQQIGGFVPVFEGCTVDTELLTPDEASELTALVAQSGIHLLRDRRIPGGADLVTVAITIEAGQAPRTVTFDLPVLPDSMKPLVAFLRRRARNLLP